MDEGIDIKALIKPMEETHYSLRNHSLEWRTDALKTVQKFISNHIDDIADALEKDLGKKYTESVVTEIQLVLNEITFHLKHLSSWMKTKPVHTPIVFAPLTSEIKYLPLSSPGVLIISPFNYPFSLALLPAVGAIAGGNPVLIKPSEYTPNVSNLLRTLINEIYFKDDGKGIMQVVLGGPEVTQCLLKNQKWGKVIFTGSERVGKIVAGLCSQTLSPCLLELGGKNPVIMCENISMYQMKVMANRLIWGKTLNAGQTCLSPDYLLCHKNSLDTLIKLLKQSLKDMFGTDIKSSELGRIVSKTHTERLITMLKEVEQFSNTESSDKSCSIPIGGSHLCSVDEKFISPTVVVNPPHNCKIMSEEIFGPILVIITIQSEEEAIRMINSVPGTPLSLYVFTPHVSQYNRIIMSCPSGMAMHNDVILGFGVTELPISGRGSSGFGKYSGVTSFDTFTHQLSSTSHPCLSLAEVGMLR